MDLGDSPATPRVLVVDDDPTVVGTLELLLEQRWLVSIAESAAEARAVLSEHEVAVIVADERMPSESGTELLAWACRIQPATIRILLTGYTDVDKVIEAVNSGRIWHYVRKPWDNQELLNLIERGLEFRASELALLRSEQVYRDLFHHAHVGIVRLDVTGRILDANPAFGGCLGYAVEELLGKHLHRLFDSGGGVSFRELRDRLLAERALRNEEIVVQARGRRPVHLLLNASLRIASGSERVIEATTLDLTARRQALQEQDKLRRQLQQVQRNETLSSFASGMVHDFSNELTIIVSAASWALEQVDAGGETEQCFIDIELAARNAAQLAKQLLSFTSECESDYAAVDLHPIIQRVLRMLSRSFRQSRLQLRLEAAEILPPVLGNASLLHRCLLNLCLNGCEAMAEGGRLTVTTAVADETDLPGGQPGSWAKIKVRDTGCGMPEDVQAKVFEPYFSTKAGRPGGGGMGLGLAMVRTIVEERHGGRITVESAPGMGSCFTVLLPCAERVSAVRLAAEPQPGTGCIAVVEDEPAIRRHVTTALRGLGYEVHAAGTGEAALQLVADLSRLDLIILDVVLPALSGEEVFFHIRHERPELPVILCTGHLASAKLREALSDRRVSLLSKPFSMVDLSSAVRRALDAQQP